MIARRKPVSLCALLLGLAAVPGALAACPGGGLERNTKLCAARTYGDEYRCLLEQNTMKTVMDCVQLETGGEDNVQCRFNDDDVSDSGIVSYFKRPIGELSREDFICLMPRRLLLFATEQFGRDCGLDWRFRECPNDDPSFLNCLCEWHIPLTSLNCLSTWFRRTTEQLTCGLSRRDEDHAGAEIDPYHPDEMALVQEEVTRRGLDFRVNQHGQPEYAGTAHGLRRRTENKAAATGHPLPYRDEIIGEGDQLRRCYSLPSSTDLYCRTHGLSRRWPLPKQKAGVTREVRSIDHDDYAWMEELGMPLRPDATKRSATGAAG